MAYPLMMLNRAPQSLWNANTAIADADGVHYKKIGTLDPNLEANIKTWKSKNNI